MKLCFRPFLALLLSLLNFACLRQNAHTNARTHLATEREMAAKKYFLTLGTALARKFFDDRKRLENTLQLWGKGMQV